MLMELQVEQLRPCKQVQQVPGSNPGRACPIAQCFTVSFNLVATFVRNECRSNYNCRRFESCQRIGAVAQSVEH